MAAHAKDLTHPHWAEVLEPLGWLAAEIGQHLLGVLAVVVVLLITAGGFLAFLSLGWFLAAVLVGLIGLLSIAAGITYWLLGETK